MVIKVMICVIVFVFLFVYPNTLISSGVDKCVVDFLDQQIG